MSNVHPENPSARPPRRILRRLLAGLGACAALLAALVLALFLFRAPLASALAPHLLARLGFPESGLKVRAIEKDRIVLEEAAAVLALGENLLRVRLEDTACGFDFRELLTGRIRRIEVGRVELAWTGQGGGDAAWTPERIARLVRGLPDLAATYIGKIPARDVRIDALILRLNLAGREWAPPPLRLTYSEAGSKAALHLAQTESETTPLAVDAELDKDGAALQGKVRADLTGLSWLPEPFRFPLRGQARAEVRLAGGGLTLDLRAEQLALAGWGAEMVKLAAGVSFAESGDMTLAADSRLDVAALAGPNITLENATLPLLGVLRFGASGLSLDWRAGNGLHLVKARLADLQIADIRATSLAAKAEYGAGQGARLMVADKSRIDIAKLSAPGVTFERLQGGFAVQGEFGAEAQNLKWRPKNPVAVDGLVTGPVAFQPVNFRDLRLHFARNAKTAALSLDSDIPELGGPLRLTWSAKSGNPEQRLTVSAPKKLHLGPEASPLNVMHGLPAILNNITIEQGRLGASLRFSWGKSPFAASLEAELADGALAWKGVGRLGGVNLKKTRLDFAPRLAMPQPADLAIQNVDCVIPLADISLRAQLQAQKRGAPLFILKEARVGVAEGQARAKNCRYDFVGQSGSCAVTLHGLDLAAMHSLRSFEGLEVSGRIDGSLPFILDKKGPGVTGGSLAGADPGVIRYRPSGETLKGSPYSEMVLKALEDYRYEKLAADVDYRPDGALRIGLKLEGVSPALQTSRPVHLNIDSEQNVLSLLKSLQYSQGLTSELNRKVQERYQGKGAK